MSQLSNTGALFNSTGLLPKSMMLNMVLHNFPWNWPLCVCAGVTSFQSKTCDRLRKKSRGGQLDRRTPGSRQIDRNHSIVIFSVCLFFSRTKFVAAEKLGTHAKLFRSNFFGPKHSLFHLSSFVSTFGVEAWPRPRWPTVELEFGGLGLESLWEVTSDRF